MVAAFARRQREHHRLEASGLQKFVRFGRLLLAYLPFPVSLSRQAPRDLDPEPDPNSSHSSQRKSSGLGLSPRVLQGLCLAQATDGGVASAAVQVPEMRCGAVGQTSAKAHFVHAKRCLVIPVCALP